MSGEWRLPDPMTIRELTGPLVREARDRFELSMPTAKRACEIALERFDGDVELGALWIHANGFAVNVRGDRNAWNESWARSEKERRDKVRAKEGR